MVFLWKSKDRLYKWYSAQSKLNSDSAIVSPFMPLVPKDSLKKTGFRILKTFELVGKKMYIKSIDFNYELVYASQRHGEYSVQSNAVIYAYTYQDEFLLPFYNVQTSSLTDYRRITSAPYNSFFWENIQEFQMDDALKKNAQFAKQTVLMSDISKPANDFYLRKGVYEHSYILWSAHRMHVLDKLPRGVVYEYLDGMHIHYMLSKGDCYGTS